MFKFKALNIFIAIFLYFLSNNLQIKIPNSPESPIKIQKTGAIFKIKNQTLIINFFGYENMPNRETVWQEEITKDTHKLEHTNKDGIHFVIQCQLTNPMQPVLTISVSKPNTKLNLRHEVLIQNNNFEACTLTTYFNQASRQHSYPLPFNAYKAKGWIAITDHDTICAIKIDNHTTELDQNTCKISTENLNSNFIVDKYTLHTSKNEYFILHNQTEFENLDKNIQFGFLHTLSKTSYVLYKKTAELANNIWVGFFLIILLFCFFSLPFFLESIRMQNLLNQMQPELDAINRSKMEFHQSQKIIQEVYARYGYSQFTHIFGQMLLIVFLSVFQNIFTTVDFLDILSDHDLTQYILIALLSFTIVCYNFVIYNNKQIIITALFTLLFFNTPKVPLLAFIVMHWINFIFWLFSPKLQ